MQRNQHCCVIVMSLPKRGHSTHLLRVDFFFYCLMSCICRICKHLLAAHQLQISVEYKISGHAMLLTLKRLTSVTAVANSKEELLVCYKMYTVTSCFFYTVHCNIIIQYTQTKCTFPKLKFLNFLCLLQGDSFGTRPEKMRISQRLFIRF